LTDSGQRLEKKVKEILEESVGTKILFEGKKFQFLEWAKPMGQKTGEVKTDFLLFLEDEKQEISMIKISGKQRNMGAVHNKLTAMWCESIYGEKWEEHMKNQMQSIVEKDGFHKDKLVNFSKKRITLGFRHEIMYEPDSGRERGNPTKSEIHPAVFWGEGCPKEYRDGKIKTLTKETKDKLKKQDLVYGDNSDFVKDSGIPDYVIKANEDEINSLENILNQLQDIKEFSKNYKDGMIDAFFAQNYRIDWKAKCKHCDIEHREMYVNDMKDGKIIGIKKASSGKNKTAKCPKCGKTGRKNSCSTPIQGTDRSMAAYVQWSVIDGKLDGIPILYENHKKDCEEVLVNLRNCLLELGIDDNSDFSIVMLRDKVTDRTQQRQCILAIQKLNQ
jgi:hypothetical protein